MFVFRNSELNQSENDNDHVIGKNLIGGCCPRREQCFFKFVIISNEFVHKQQEAKMKKKINCVIDGLKFHVL